MGSGNRLAAMHPITYARANAANAGGVFMKTLREETPIPSSFTANTRKPY